MKVSIASEKALYCGKDAITITINNILIKFLLNIFSLLQRLTSFIISRPCQKLDHIKMAFDFFHLSFSRIKKMQQNNSA